MQKDIWENLYEFPLVEKESDFIAAPAAFQAMAEDLKTSRKMGSITIRHMTERENGSGKPKGRIWNWLLVIPLLGLMFPGVYARQTPELFGFPFFYWYQMAWILLTGVITAAVFALVKE